MTTGAIVFMSLTWIAVLTLNVYCFSKLLRENSGEKSSEP